MFLYLSSVFKVVVIAIYTAVMSLIGGVALLLKNGEEKYHALALHWARVILRLSGVEVAVRNREVLEHIDSCVYISNHASFYDSWILLAHLKGQVRFVGKKELTRIPIFGWIWKYSGHIVIDRSKKSEYLVTLEKARFAIQRGRSIIIFPEGTRTHDGKLLPFKRGSFSLALKAQVPIVPVVVNGSFKILPKGSFKIVPGRVEVVICQPINVDRKVLNRQEEVELIEKVRNEMQEFYIEQS